MATAARQSHVREIDTPDTIVPQIALLGDRRYNVLVTAAGSGVSRHAGIAVSRWRNDGTRDAYGQWCYLKNVGTGQAWSAGHQPLCADYSAYDAALSGDCVRIRRKDGDFETVTEIAVLRDVAGEARRVSVTNNSGRDTDLEITSYQEVVLASAVLDRGHRAFRNLFVQTEWLADGPAILAMRRPRSAAEKTRWCGHSMAVSAVAGVSCETDRALFIGRGRSPRNPVTMDAPGELSGSAGAVLDPVLALRARVGVPAGETISAVFTTYVTENRGEAVERACAFGEFRGANQAIEDAIAAGDTAAGELGISPARAAGLHELAGDLLYGPSRLPTGTREDLLALELTGDAPIVLAAADNETDATAVDELLDLHEYWTRKGILHDLVIIAPGEAATRLVSGVVSGRDVATFDPHGILVLDGTVLEPSQLALLGSVARLRLSCAGGVLAKANG